MKKPLNKNSWIFKIGVLSIKSDLLRSRELNETYKALCSNAYFPMNAEKYPPKLSGTYHVVCEDNLTKRLFNSVSDYDYVNNKWYVEETTCKVITWLNKNSR